MRELPPESLLRVLHSDRPAEPPFAVYGYPRDQVLAIQKQAYEDGLMAAEQKCHGRFEYFWFTGDNRRAQVINEMRKEIASMLTASQKEQQ